MDKINQLEHDKSFKIVIKLIQTFILLNLIDY